MNRKLANEELGRISIETYKSSEKTPISIVLDNIRSLNNIGSVFRTADAFLIEKIYLCGITAKPPHRDIQKTALGATESVAWEYFEKTADAIDELKSNQRKIVGIEQTENGIALDEFEVNPTEKLALVLGNEVKGIDQDIVNLCDQCIEIPQLGTKHSLNISVAAGIVAWDLFVKFKA